jgi:hypothetical protein
MGPREPRSGLAAGQSLRRDGFGFRAEEPVDAIVVNAGVSHFTLPWLDSLKMDKGQLPVPFANVGRVAYRQSRGRALSGSSCVPGGNHRFARAAATPKLKRD